MRSVNFLKFIIAIFYISLIVFWRPLLDLAKRACIAAAPAMKHARSRLARVVRPPWSLLFAMGLLVISSALWQADEQNMDGIYALLLYFLLAVVAVAVPKLGLGIFLFWLLHTLYQFAGSPHPTLDVAILTAAFVIAIYLVLRDERWRLPVRWPTDWQALLIALLFLPSVWVLLSICDALTEFRLEPSSSSPNSRVQDRDSPKAKIGLAMSGGGYRAALFHAGVISALEQSSIPIQVMTSVSGGSIFASFYSRGGTPDQFLDAVIRGSFRLERYILRIDNALCLLGSVQIPAGLGSFTLVPLSPDCSRTSMQSRLLERTLLGKAEANTGSVQGRPELMLATTDLAESRMIGFTPSGFVNIWLRGSLERFSFINTAVGGRRYQAAFFPEHLAHLPGDQPLSALVAASGAFPGALPSYRIRAPYTVKGQHGMYTYLLADGGLTDNSGIVLLDAAQLLSREAEEYVKNPFPPSDQNPPSEWHIPQWNIDLIVASDASAFGGARLPEGTLGEFVHAMEVMSGNSAAAELLVERARTGDPRPPIVLLSPRSFSSDPPDEWNGRVRISLPGIEGFVVNGRTYRVPARLREETLRYFVERMPAAERKIGRTLLGDLVSSGIITAEGISFTTSSALLVARNRTDLENLEKLECVTQLISDELERRFLAYLQTPTLRDQIDRTTAESIFTLGQYMVLLEKGRMGCFMTKLQAGDRDLGDCSRPHLSF
jgi:predicted acylesterase/phospholipase RssA